MSLKSGHIFEKALILKQIEAVGICPVTEKSLLPEDLLDIQCQHITKPRVDHSMNSFMSGLQESYDQILLENYNLKSQL